MGDIDASTVSLLDTVYTRCGKGVDRGRVCMGEIRAGTHAGLHII